MIKLTEVETIEVIELPCTIVASEKKHHVFIDCSRGSVSTLGPDAVSVGLEIYLGPSPFIEVESIEIISVMTIVSSEDVHAVFVDHCRMTMSRSWWRCIAYSNTRYLLPRLILNAEFIEIVNSVEAVIASEYVDRSVMYN